MLAVPTPSYDEARDNAVFNALLWCMARPGFQHRLPEESEKPIVDALIDRECQVFCTDTMLLPDLMRTGAQFANIRGADHVFLGQLSNADILDGINCGSDLYPDDGASVVVRCAFAGEEKLQLTGPGINGSIRVAIAGLPDGFWQKRSRMMRYPIGFDLILIDGASVMAVPRSTRVEMI